MHGPWGLAVVSAPPLCVGLSPESAPKATQENGPPPSEAGAEAETGRSWQPVQVGAPPSACGGWGLHVGKAAAMAAPRLACHSTTAPCLYGSPGFFRERSQLWSSSLPSPQAVSSQLTAVHSQGLLSKPHVPAPRPRAPRRTPVRLRHAGLWHAGLWQGPSLYLSLPYLP